MNEETQHEKHAIERPASSNCSGADYEYTLLMAANDLAFHLHEITALMPESHPLRTKAIKAIKKAERVVKRKR